jgi:UDP-glucose 4-epimerase
MTEIMLRDAGTAHRLPHMILRYFNRRRRRSARPDRGIT